ncbi:LysR substrate-binding domain-containing protein, partial [Streptomyces alkaliphilus]|uniref:LysR substrate-binding domain-containing protein n=1 Tax=Streptomyces alkaliphilus TaxID=1472722 RepID=UPI001195F97C
CIRDSGRGPVRRRWGASPWITAPPGTLCHAMTVRACHASGFEPRIRHRVDDIDTVLGLVAIGAGVTPLPATVRAGAPSGVVWERLPIRRRTLLAHRRGAAGHPAVRAMGEALRAVVPAEPAEGWPTDGR